MFKNPAVIGLTNGRFHCRHIPNLALLVTFVGDAHNVHICLKPEADAAEAAAAALAKHRLLLQRSSQWPWCWTRVGRPPPSRSQHLDWQTGAIQPHWLDRGLQTG